MARAQKILVFALAFLGSLLPVIIYLIEHGGLGAPTFAEFKAMDAGQQFAQAAAGLVIKPLYMFASFGLIVLLVRERAVEIAATTWGLIAFLVGEVFCGLNFIFYQHASLTSEYVHSAGMVLAFAFFAFAFLEILDRRLLHINAGRCALNGLCQTCKRATPLACAARRTSILTISLAGLASFLPLTASSTPESYATSLFGFDYSYARFGFYQWYETRALPVLALALFLLALLPLLRAKGDPIPLTTKFFFSAGIGGLGFSLFRLTLASVFADNLVWFEFWEELAELMFISAIAFLVWQFRDRLSN
ncbi:MAG: hypothetical protein AB1750_06055 [Chloroflexota bacterium]